MKTSFYSDKTKNGQKIARFYKMAKCIFSWPAHLKMAKFCEIGHEMANLATLLRPTA